MEIHLSSFEMEIDETILKRGFGYYKKGKVTHFEEITPGVYEASVEGTEMYAVKFKFDGDAIRDIQCSCPYVDGPVCKHVAAVLFYLAAELAGENEHPKPKAAKPSNPKPKSGPNYREIIDNIPVEELKEFLVDEIENDESAKSRFQMAFAQCFSFDIAAYKKQLTSAIQSAKGRYRFIEYGKSIDVANKGNQVLDVADKLVGKGNYQDALDLYLVVAERMMSALNSADDSGGAIGGCISYAMEEMTKLSITVTGKVRKNLFNSALKHITKDVFHGWDWEDDLMNIAISCVETQKEYELLMARIDSQIDVRKGEKYGDFYIQRLQVQRYCLLNAFGKSDEADKFLNDNMQNDDFRQIAIDKAVASNNFQHAYSLAEEGAAIYEEDGRRVSIRWHNAMLKIALVEKNVERLVEEARILVLYRYSQEHLQLLRENVPDYNWQEFVEALAEDALAVDNEQLYTTLCVEENWQDKLFQYIQRKCNFILLDKYAPFLKDGYSDQLVELYEKTIMNDVRNTLRYKDRKYYQSICREIRKMKKLGGHRRADAVVDTLKKMFPRSPAFQEELNEV